MTTNPYATSPPTGTHAAALSRYAKESPMGIQEVALPPTRDRLPCIEVAGLTKQFDEVTAVDRISFAVGQGELFRILGPDGAGKTTTINMLSVAARSCYLCLEPRHVVDPTAVAVSPSDTNS
jgi:ABC-type glutathione transport system ATPase component